MPRPESCGWQTVPTCCPSHPESWKGDEMTLARNAFALLDRTTESHAGDRTAYGFEGEVRTFREMRDASLEVAAGLAANGVGRGDKVAVMLGNRFEWVETFFGLAALGAVRSEERRVGNEVVRTCR